MSKNEDMRRAFERALEEDPYDKLSHDAYADWLDENGFDEDLALWHRTWTPARQQSVEWLADYARRLEDEKYYEDGDGVRRRYPPDDEVYDYGWLIDQANHYLNTGDWFCLPFDTPAFVWQERQSFWHHFSMATGRKVRKGEDGAAAQGADAYDDSCATCSDAYDLGDDWPDDTFFNCAC